MVSVIPKNLVLFECKPIYPRSPACKWASIQRLLVQLHGSSPPAGFLSAALIACDGFITLGL